MIRGENERCKGQQKCGKDPKRSFWVQKRRKLLTETLSDSSWDSNEESVVKTNSSRNYSLVRTISWNIIDGSSFYYCILDHYGKFSFTVNLFRYNRVMEVEIEKSMKGQNFPKITCV